VDVEITVMEVFFDYVGRLGEIWPVRDTERGRGDYEGGFVLRVPVKAK